MKVRQYPNDETTCDKGLNFNDERISEGYSSDFDDISEEDGNSVDKDGQDLEKLAEIRDELRDNLQSLENCGQDVTDEAEHIICSEQDIVHVPE